VEIGPLKMEHEERLKIAEGIGEQLQAHFGERIIAIGIYGSLANGTDGPFSDIEMHCVLENIEPKTPLRWSNGTWKAKVDLDTVSSIMGKAAEVSWNWPVTHSAFTEVKPLVDPTNLFIHLRRTALTQPELKFRHAIRDLILGDIYELAGKIRNAYTGGNQAMLPYYAVQQAHRGACLIGLGNRFLYPTPAKLFSNSLELEAQPAGYDMLCRLVISGQMSDVDLTFSVCEQYWLGVQIWAKDRGIRLTEDLKDLLQRFN